MRAFVRTEIGVVVAFAVSVLTAYTGLAISVSGRDKLVGVLLLMVGLWGALSAPAAHNRCHLERGETPHLVPRWQQRFRPPGS
jgi:hypothetical protein